MRSRKPEAKEFQRWVTHEVLPQIRKTGGYIPTTDMDDDMTILAKAVMIGQRTMETQKRRIAEQYEHIKRWSRKRGSRTRWPRRTARASSENSRRCCARTV